MSDLKGSFVMFFLPEHSSQRMKIPPAYREYMKGKRSGDVYLRGPSGYYWKTKLVHENHNLYLTEGWSVFLEDHGIERGHFFMFKFDGKWTFKVKLFSPTGCRDKAGLTAKPSQGLDNNPGKEIVKVKEEEKEEDTQRSAGFSSAMGDLTVSLPHFTVQIKEYNVSAKTVHLGIPSAFVRIHLFHFEDLKTEVALRWHDKEWPVTVRQTYLRTYISRGWQEFVNGAKVQAGDTCKFELVDRFALRVHITKPIKK